MRVIATVCPTLGTGKPISETDSGDCLSTVLEYGCDPGSQILTEQSSGRPWDNHSGYEIIWDLNFVHSTPYHIFPLDVFSRRPSEDCRSCRQSWAPTSPIYRWFSQLNSFKPSFSLGIQSATFKMTPFVCRLPIADRPSPMSAEAVSFAPFTWHDQRAACIWCRWLRWVDEDHGNVTIGSEPRSLEAELSGA